MKNQYHDLKYKTISTLTELDANVSTILRFISKVKVKLNSGELSWDELGDLNRLKVGLNEFTFLEKYKK